MGIAAPLRPRRPHRPTAHLLIWLLLLAIGAPPLPAAAQAEPSPHPAPGPAGDPAPEQYHTVTAPLPTEPAAAARARAQIEAAARRWLERGWILAPPLVGDDHVALRALPRYAGDLAAELRALSAAPPPQADAPPVAPLPPPDLVSQGPPRLADLFTVEVNLTNNSVEGLADANAPVQITIRAQSGGIKAALNTTSDANGLYSAFPGVDLVAGDEIAASSGGASCAFRAPAIVGGISVEGQRASGTTTPGAALQIFLYQIDRFVYTAAAADGAGRFSVTAAQLGVPRIRSDDFAWVYLAGPTCGSVTKQTVGTQVLKASTYGQVSGHGPHGATLTISAYAADGSLRRSVTASASADNGSYQAWLGLTLQRGDRLVARGGGYERSLSFIPLNAWGYQSTDTVAGSGPPGGRVDVFLERAYQTAVIGADGRFSVAYPAVSAGSSLQLMLEEPDGDLTYASADITRVAINAAGRWGDWVEVTVPEGSSVSLTVFRGRYPYEFQSSTASSSYRTIYLRGDLRPGDVVQISGPESLSFTVPNLPVTIDQAAGEVRAQAAPLSPVELSVYRSWVSSSSNWAEVTTDGGGTARFAPGFYLGPGTVATAAVGDASGNSFYASAVVPFVTFYGGSVAWCDAELPSAVALRRAGNIYYDNSAPWANGLGCGEVDFSPHFPEPGDVLTLAFPRGATEVGIPDARLHINKYLDRLTGQAPAYASIALEVYRSYPPYTTYAYSDGAGAYVADLSGHGLQGGDTVYARYAAADNVLFSLSQGVPYVTVRPRAGYATISGELINGTTASLTVRTLTGATRAQLTFAADSGGWFWELLEDAAGRSITLQPGDSLLFSNDGIQETVVVPDLRVSALDRAGDVIAGSGPAGAAYEIAVSNSCNGCASRELSATRDVSADGAGAFRASFAGEFDLDRGHDVTIGFLTPERSKVLFAYVVPTRVLADSTRDTVYGYTAPGRPLTVTLRDRLGVVRHQQTATSDADGSFSLAMGVADQPVDISAGDSVEVSVALGGGGSDTTVLRVAPVSIALAASASSATVETVANRPFDWWRGGTRYQSGEAVAGPDGRRELALEPLGVGDYVEVTLDSGDFSGGGTVVSAYLPALISVDESQNTINVQGPAFADASVALLRGGVALATRQTRIGRWNQLPAPLSLSVASGIVDILPYDEVRVQVAGVTVSAQVQQLSVQLDLGADAVTGRGPPQMTLGLELHLGGRRGDRVDVRTDQSGDFRFALPQGSDLAAGDYAVLALAAAGGHATQVRAYSTSPTAALGSLPASVAAPGTLQVSGSWGGGQRATSASLVWDTTSRAVERSYRGSAALTIGSGMAAGAVSLPAITGTLYVALRMEIDGQSVWSPERSLALTRPAAESSAEGWTVMLYLDGDNDLTSYMSEAIRRLRQMRLPAGVGVAILFDGYAPNDTIRYLLRPGRAPGAFTSAEQQPMGELNMGSPETLVEFVAWARAQLPARHTYLAIANHGDGLVGIAYDVQDAPGRMLSRGDPLTLEELEGAMGQLTSGGQQRFSVLHLDGCLMSTLETIYQLRAAADYMVTSESLGWSVFAYDRYLPLMAPGATPAQVSRGIVDAYVAAVRSGGNLPVTQAALDLRQAEPLARATSALAEALIAQGAAGKSALQAVRPQVQKLDSRQFGVIDNDDQLVDLGHLAELLAARLPGTTVAQAAQSVKAGLAALVIKEAHQSGQMPEGVYRENAAQGVISFATLSGVSIFLPRTTLALGQQGEIDSKYQNYINGRLRFTQDHSWDNLLTAYFGPVALAGDQPAADVYDVPPTLPLHIGGDFGVFLPTITR